MNVLEPMPVEGGVVVRVEATGVCRNDRHNGAGHDADIELPILPGHWLAGTIVAVDEGVKSRATTLKKESVSPKSVVTVAQRFDAWD